MLWADMEYWETGSAQKLGAVLYFINSYLPFLPSFSFQTLREFWREKRAFLERNGEIFDDFII